MTGSKKLYYNDLMKTLRNPGKVDVLLSMFENVGDAYTVNQVCEITGIVNYNSLKAMLSYIRKAKHIPDENRIDVRIRDNKCTRIH